MKIIHTADWHLGQTFFEYDRKGDILYLWRGFESKWKFTRWMCCLLPEIMTRKFSSKLSIHFWSRWMSQCGGLSSVPKRVILISTIWLYHSVKESIHTSWAVTAYRDVIRNKATLRWWGVELYRFWRKYNRLALKGFMIWQKK